MALLIMPSIKARLALVVLLSMASCLAILMLLEADLGVKDDVWAIPLAVLFGCIILPFGLSIFLGGVFPESFSVSLPEIFIWSAHAIFIAAILAIICSNNLRSFRVSVGVFCLLLALSVRGCVSVDGGIIFGA